MRIDSATRPLDGVSAQGIAFADLVVDLPPGQLELGLGVVEVKAHGGRSLLRQQLETTRYLSGNRTTTVIARIIAAAAAAAMPWLELELRWHYLIAVLAREVRMDP